jgi:polyhydroxyalkanoate synthesis regulator phasin
VDTGSSESNRKRKHVNFDVDDEYGLEQTDDAFDRELQDVLTAVETPSKAVKTSALATPSTRRKLPWQMDQQTKRSSAGLQTPQTGRKTPYDPFNTCLNKSGVALFTPSRNHESDDETHQNATPSSSFETPTPSRFCNISPNDLVRDVLEFLQESHVQLATDAQDGLKDLLSKHAKTAEGIRRGRDVIRSTVKAKDAKITELTYRVSTLECELEAEKAMVKHLQWEAGVEDP